MFNAEIITLYSLSPSTPKTNKRVVQLSVSIQFKYDLNWNE